MLKIRRPLGRLIFNMGIAIPGKTVFLIETAPCFLSDQFIMKRLFSLAGPSISNVQRAETGVTQDSIQTPLHFKQVFVIKKKHLEACLTGCVNAFGYQLIEGGWRMFASRYGVIIGLGNGLSPTHPLAIARTITDLLAIELEIAVKIRFLKKKPSHLHSNIIWEV